MSLSVKPPPAELPAFYRAYVEHVQGNDLLDAMRITGRRMKDLLQDAGPALGDHRYAPGKWTVKEVLQHVIDAERIFAYRALRFARGDASELPGFDEDAYAPASEAGRRTLADLLPEHDAVREASIRLFQSFTPAMLLRGGIANERSISVRAIGWTIAGHAEHHVRVLAERYIRNA